MTGDLEGRALAVRRDAQQVLAPLVDLAAPVGPDADAPWDQLVRIGAHEVDRAAECGASLAYAGEFDGWRSAFARKHLGRLVLERMRRGATLDPGAIARTVADELAREGRTSLGQWLGGLGPGGTAAVVRDATTFAITARAELKTWPPIDGTRFESPLAAYTWQVAGRAVRLEATADGIATASRSLLLLATSTIDEAQVRRQIAWLSLVAALAVGRVPRTVTRIDLASGDRRTVPVTDDVIDLGLTVGAAAAEAAIGARYTTPPTPVPGPWCSRCRGREVCPVAFRKS